MASVFGKRYQYQSGFGNEFQTEAVPGALPRKQNNPQKCPLGLYAEQLSGSAFTAPRHTNRRTWLYRIRPSVAHGRYTRLQEPRAPGLCYFADVVTPERLRWHPRRLPDKALERVDFVRGLFRIAGSGNPSTRDGLSIYSYVCNVSMSDCAFYDADGDMLIVPQAGVLKIRTELGFMRLAPGECAVMPRGIRFAVFMDRNGNSGNGAADGNAVGYVSAGLDNESENADCARGFVLEVFNGHFELPDLGPIGGNGLAAPRDFLHPIAAYEDRECSSGFEVITKFQDAPFRYETDHSVFDVVAWHGNYAPYKYDLCKFCPVNSVRFDHMDPSIYTVLTCKSNEPGVAIADFVVFPPRWSVQEHTFRPPYFHRNCMSEFMANIAGNYDAKEGGGFAPGSCSLHSAMSAHGPDVETYNKAVGADLHPHRMRDADLAIMFESSRMLKLTAEAIEELPRDTRYIRCWDGFPKKFNAPAAAAAPGGGIGRTPPSSHQQ